MEGADDALLIYTSGTTGKPKGCMLTHKNVCTGGEFTSEAHQLSVQDRVLRALPLCHINGQIVTAVTPLLHGGSSVRRLWPASCSNSAAGVPPINCFHIRRD